MGQRKSGHVTLLDIARTSGFSVSTVSTLTLLITHDNEDPCSRYAPTAMTDNGSSRVPTTTTWR